MNDRHRHYQPGFCLWLAAGAMTFGVGAAVAGSAVAHADTEVAAPPHRTGVAERPRGHSVHPRVSAVKAATTANVPPDPWQRGLQQALNGFVPLVNNTPIRYLLDAIDPPSSQPGSTGVRLLGVAGGSALSPDGTRMFQVTSAGYGIFPCRAPSFHSVTEIDTATGTVIGVPVVIDGAPVGAPVVSSDGSRAYQTSYGIDAVTGSTMTFVTTINTSTDTVVGTPVQISGAPGIARVVLSPDGSRAYQTTSGPGPAGGLVTTLTTIDTARGIAVGTPLTLQGAPAGDLLISADGSRLYQTTNPKSPETTLVTVINGADSTIVGQSIAIDGFPNGGVVLSPDGVHAAQTVDGRVVTLIDTADASIARTTVVEGVGNGSPFIAPVFSDNGARVSQVSMVLDPVSGAYTTILTVIDTATGAIVGTPVVLPALSVNQVVVGVPDPAGSRIVVGSGIEDPATRTLDSTVVTVVETSDGSVIGAPVTLSGYARGNPVAAGALRVIQTNECCVMQYPTTAVIGVLDTDGNLIGSPVTLAASPLGPAVVSSDGARAYQTLLVVPTAETRVYSTLVAAIDTTTGGLIGTPVTVSGSADISSVLLTPDGRLAFETTATENSFMRWFFPTLVTRVDTMRF